MNNLKLLTLLFTLANASTLRAESKLKPFETDGCTMFIDGTTSSPGLWRTCCVEHDLRYWFGGSQDDMDATDLRLKSCVEKKAGATWANLIYMGVRAGHHSPVKNKTQWNWGWVEKRAYSPLTLPEIAVAKAELRSLTLTEVDIEEFIKINFP